MYKFSICDWKLPVPGTSTITLAGELGYNGVQILDFGGARKGFPLSAPWVQNHLLKLMDKSGVIIDTLQLNEIAATGQIACHPNSEQGKLGLESVKRSAKICKDLNIPRVMLESVDVTFKDCIHTPQDLENAAAFLRVAADILGEADVVCTYESFADVEKTLTLYESSGKCFKLCYDTMNPIRFGFGDPLVELPIYFERDMIDFIHFKDMSDDGQSGVAPFGTGIAPFQKCVEIIQSYHYDGWLVTENNYGLMGSRRDAFAAMRQDLETMQCLFPNT